MTSSFQFGVLQNVLGEPLETLFTIAREDGFDGVELDWNSPEDAQDGGSLAPDKREGIKAAAANAGVEIHAVAAHFLNAAGPASPDDAVRAAAVQAIRDGLQLAKDVGASALLVPFFGQGERDLADAQGQDRLVGELQLVAGKAAVAGVFIGIESTLPGPVVAKMCDRTRSTHIGSYWDMANGMSVGLDPLEEVRALGTRIVRVHAKEFEQAKVPPGERAPGSYPGLNTVPLGQGDVPVRAILEELKRVGYRGYLTLETGGFDDRRASARAAVQVLRAAAEGL